MAGFFFAFSITVMKPLGAIPPAQGISAMQSINVVVINPWFLTPFFGMAASSLLLSIAAMPRWHEPSGANVIAGCLLYFLGTFLMTMLFNVPRNNALEAVAATSPEGAALGGLLGRLDEVEPRAHLRRAGGRRVVHDRARSVAPSSAGQ